MDNQEGGADWEIGAAAQALTAAWLAWADDPTPGHFSAYEEAARRHAAAVTSKSTSAFAGSLSSVLLGQAELRKIFERSERADLDRWVEFRAHLDSRLDAYGRELDELKAEGRAQHQRSNEERGEMRDTLGALVESVEVLSLELENVRRRTLANEIDPSERLQLHQWLRDNQAVLARIIQKHDGNL